MLGDGFGHPEKDPFKVIDFPCVLHFHEDDFPLAVFGLDVHSVELVRFRQLVAFAFQYLHDLCLVLEEHGEQSFQDGKVGFVPEQPFDGPVEPYVSVF